MATTTARRERKGPCAPSPERPELQDLQHAAEQRAQEREAFADSLQGEDQALCKIAFEARRMCQGNAGRYERYYQERFGKSGGAYLYAHPKTKEFLAL